jgi:hypothetical protein
VVHEIPNTPERWDQAPGCSKRFPRSMITFAGSNRSKPMTCSRRCFLLIYAVSPEWIFGPSHIGNLPNF